MVRDIVPNFYFVDTVDSHRNNAHMLWIYQSQSTLLGAKRTFLHL